MSDAPIEAGRSDALVDAVANYMMRAASCTGTLVHPAEILFAARYAVNRLRMGGISDLVIRKCLCGDGFCEPIADMMAFDPAEPGGEFTAWTCSCGHANRTPAGLPIACDKCALSPGDIPVWDE